MKRFEILEHRADLKIRVFGKTKEELFLSALLGMESGLRPDFRNPPNLEGFRKSRHIKVSSPDLNALLVDFLSEALYLIQTNKEIYDSVKFNKFTDTHSAGSGQAEIEAELFGQKVERFGEDIKAVTYHGLDIQQKNNKLWEAVILFDI